VRLCADAIDRRFALLMLHCARDVAMLTPSIWSERLDPRIHRFASRLDWIGRTIRKYNEMLAMLGSNIPNPSFEIYYEKLTTVGKIIIQWATSAACPAMVC
jgi:hypothetical protein